MKNNNVREWTGRAEKQSVGIWLGIGWELVGNRLGIGWDFPPFPFAQQAMQTGVYQCIF